MSEAPSGGFEGTVPACGPALDWQSRMRAETVARLSPLAKYLLDLQ